MLYNFSSHLSFYLKTLVKACIANNKIDKNYITPFRITFKSYNTVLRVRAAAETSRVQNPTPAEKEREREGERTVIIFMSTS